jgi:hypothetical protein
MFNLTGCALMAGFALLCIALLVLVVGFVLSALIPAVCAL